mgnify:CR=1 FL=1
MNLRKLFDMQKVLDQRIIDQHELDDQELFPNKSLALLVEVGELANEWQGFKHWKVDPQPKAGMLEEYVDCLHFILSIGNDLGFDDNYHSVHGSFQMLNIVEQFEVIFHTASSLSVNKTLENYQNLFELFLGLGEMLGFTTHQIELAYVGKNTINHTRQESGY